MTSIALQSSNCCRASRTVLRLTRVPPAHPTPTPTPPTPHPPPPCPAPRTCGAAVSRCVIFLHPISSRPFPAPPPGHGPAPADAQIPGAGAQRTHDQGRREQSTSTNSARSSVRSRHVRACVRGKEGSRLYQSCKTQVRCRNRPAGGPGAPNAATQCTAHGKRTLMPPCRQLGSLHTVRMHWL